MGRQQANFVIFIATCTNSVLTAGIGQSSPPFRCGYTPVVNSFLVCLKMYLVKFFRRKIYAYLP